MNVDLAPTCLRATYIHRDEALRRSADAASWATSALDPDPEMVRIAISRTRESAILAADSADSAEMCAAATEDMAPGSEEAHLAEGAAKAARLAADAALSTLNAAHWARLPPAT